jgi:CxxC-x17-CxxC domain-containing protein
LEDRTLTCKDCGTQFVFTAREQQFFAERGFMNLPARCKTCRQARRAHGATGETGRSARPSFEAVCAACGVSTTVPFRPRGDRPVYCRECYVSRVPAGV